MLVAALRHVMLFFANATAKNMILNGSSSTMCHCHELLHTRLDFSIEGTWLRALPTDLICVYIAPMVAASPPAIEYCQIPSYGSIDLLDHFPDIPEPGREDSRYWRQLRIWTRLGITFVASWDVCAAYRVTDAGYKKITEYKSLGEYGSCWRPRGMFICSSREEYIMFNSDKFIPIDLPELKWAKTRTVIDTACGTLDVSDGGVNSIWNMNVNPPDRIDGRCGKTTEGPPIVFFE